MNRPVTASTLAMIVLAFLGGCVHTSPDRDSLYQHGELSVDRPEAKPIPLNEVRRRGNFGFGQLADTPGLIVLHGNRTLQVTSAGRIRKPRYDEKLTAALVTAFDTDSRFETLQPRHLNQFVAYVEKVIDRRSASYAIKVTGRFHYIKTSPQPGGSTPKRIHRNITGTLIGFRLVDYRNGKPRSRYPLVFVNRTERFGGFVRNFTVNDATITLDRLSNPTPPDRPPQPNQTDPPR